MSDSAPLPMDATRDDDGPPVDEMDVERTVDDLAACANHTDQSGQSDISRRLRLLASHLPELIADKARVDWLEAHDYHATCYNVPTDTESDHWAAPMKPNNGWVIGMRADGEDSDDDPHGATLRDAVDWAMKLAARTPGGRTDG